MRVAASPGLGAGVTTRSSTLSLTMMEEIGIAAGDEDEISLELALFVDRSGAVDAGVEAVIRAEFGEQGAFGEQLGGGGGDEKFIGVEGIEDFASIEGDEFDSEVGVGELGAAHYFLNAVGERRRGLRAC